MQSNTPECSKLSSFISASLRVLNVRWSFHQGAQWCCPTALGGSTVSTCRRHWTTPRWLRWASWFDPPTFRRSEPVRSSDQSRLCRSQRQKRTSRSRNRRWCSWSRRRMGRLTASLNFWINWALKKRSRWTRCRWCRAALSRNSLPVSPCPMAKCCSSLSILFSRRSEVSWTAPRRTCAYHFQLAPTPHPYCLKFFGAYVYIPGNILVLLSFHLHYQSRYLCRMRVLLNKSAVL